MKSDAALRCAAHSVALRAVALACAVTALGGCARAHRRPTPAKSRASAAPSAAPPVAQEPIVFRKAGFPLTADQLPEATDYVDRTVIDTSDRVDSWLWAAGYCGGDPWLTPSETRRTGPDDLHARSMLRDALLCGKALLASAPKPVVEYGFSAGGAPVLLARFPTPLPATNALKRIADPALSVPAYRVQHSLARTDVGVGDTVPNLNGVWLRGDTRTFKDCRFLTRERLEKRHAAVAHDHRAELLELLRRLGDADLAWAEVQPNDDAQIACGMPLTNLLDSVFGRKWLVRLPPWAEHGEFDSDIHQWASLCGGARRGPTTTYVFVGRNASGARQLERTLRRISRLFRSLRTQTRPGNGTSLSDVEWRHGWGKTVVLWHALARAKLSRSGNVLTLTFRVQPDAAEKRLMQPYLDAQARAHRAEAHLLAAVAAGRLPAADDLHSLDTFEDLSNTDPGSIWLP